MLRKRGRRGERGGEKGMKARLLRGQAFDLKARGVRIETIQPNNQTEQLYQTFGVIGFTIVQLIGL